MKIEHIAIWTNDMEQLKLFYEKYFGAKVGINYVNPRKQFSSYFLSFESGCRLEIMHKPALAKNANLPSIENTGFAHFAFSVGGRDNVDKLTELLRMDGFTIISYPRQTGDGYYESTIADPDTNVVEITC